VAGAPQKKRFGTKTNPKIAQATQSFQSPAVQNFKKGEETTNAEDLFDTPLLLSPPTRSSSSSNSSGTLTSSQLHHKISETSLDSSLALDPDYLLKV